MRKKEKPPSQRNRNKANFTVAGGAVPDADPDARRGFQIYLTAKEKELLTRAARQLDDELGNRTHISLSNFIVVSALKAAEKYTGGG